MSKTILAVEYRHHDLMAYVMVGGRTKNAAERTAKELNTKVKEALPNVQLYPPRAKGFDEDGIFIFEVPIGIDQHPKDAKPYLTRLLLRGSV